MDPFTLKKLAGHTDLNTTIRYVHLNDDDVRAAMAKAPRWQKIGHRDDGHRDETGNSHSAPSKNRLWFMELAEGLEPPTL
jgi:hypothetical protein